MMKRKMGEGDWNENKDNANANIYTREGVLQEYFLLSGILIWRFKIRFMRQNSIDRHLR